MRSLILFPALLSATLITGCARTLTVTYQSDPPGAVLYEGQKRLGYTPKTVYYNVNPREASEGVKLVAPTSVKWVSGASASVSGLKFDLAHQGYFEQYTFDRPDQVPGRAKDEEFSLELDRTKAIQTEAAAQNRIANAEETRAQEAAQPVHRRPNCVTVLSGSALVTSCQ